MNIFDYDNYKKYFNAWIENQPKQGYGEYRRVSMALGISTTMVSQVFKGDKELSLELACDLADYLHLDEDETEFLLLLVEHAKAGSHKLKQRLYKRIEVLQKRHQDLQHRFKKHTVLDDKVKAIFYSSWLYSAVRLVSDIEGLDDVQSISEKICAPRNQVQRVLDFLLEHGLVVKKGSKLTLGPTKTHLEATSPLIVRHHQNWRTQAFNKMAFYNENNLFFSAPMSMSYEVAQKVREKLPSFIESVFTEVGPSKSETTYCLSIDWFEF